MSASRHSRYELLTLTMVSIASLLALSPLVAPLRSWLLEGLGHIPREYSWLDLATAYLFALGITIVTQRIVVYYLLLEKGEQSLGRAFSILILFGIALRLPWMMWALPVVYMAVLVSLFGSYQMWRGASRFLLLGLGVGGLSLLSAKAMLLLPLVFVVMYQQRTLYLKHILALLHGVILTALGAFAVLGVDRSLDLGHRWLTEWTQWQSVPWGLEHYAPYAWLTFGGLSLLCMVLVAFVTTTSHSNIRQSAQMQSLTTMLFFALGLWTFDAVRPLIYASLAHLPFVVLLPKAIAQLSGLRYQRWATIVLMSVLFVLLFLS